jgi:protein-tyrosine phosphatase
MSYRVLLICMGNICRSPTAEGVLRKHIQLNMLGDKVEVDSAGTHGYHVGEAPDARTQRAASARGYNLSQLRARKVAPQDLDYFDLILAMDRTNLDNLKRMATAEQQKRIKLFMDYARNFDDDEVPDPYYGLGHGFDLVLDMVEDAAQGLIDDIRQNISGADSR